MKRIQYFAVSLVTAGAVAAGAVGVASAASTKTAADVGKSGIPRSVFSEDHLQAEATVLNTTTDAVKTAHKDKTFKQLLEKAGLNHKTFAEKVRAAMKTKLESQGYTQTQVTEALHHRAVVHHKHHAAKKTT